jgi:hypothetical protein
VSILSKSDSAPCDVRVIGEEAPELVQLPADCVVIGALGPRHAYVVRQDTGAEVRQIPDVPEPDAWAANSSAE